MFNPTYILVAIAESQGKPSLSGEELLNELGLTWEDIASAGQEINE